MDAAYWIAHEDLLILLSYRTQDDLPRAGTTHSDALGPPTSVTNSPTLKKKKQKTLTGFPTGQSDGGNFYFYLKFLLPKRL